jgi:hypothetical protein
MSVQRNVGVEQQVHLIHSSLSIAGATISPTICPVPSIDPNQRFGRTAGGGKISATGSPNLVTRIGFLVFRTCSRTERHVALNFDMAISCMRVDHTMVNLHGQDYTNTRFTTLPRTPVRR